MEAQQFKFLWNISCYKAMARPRVQDMRLPRRHRVGDPTTSNNCTCVFVVKVNRTTYFLTDILLSDDVDKVKRKIEARIAIPAPRQIVLYAGRILTDGHKLSDYNIRYPEDAEYAPTLHVLVGQNPSA